HGELLGGRDLERHAVATDAAATARGEVSTGVAAPDLGERAVDIGGGDPVLGGLAVDGQLQLTGEADGDPRAVGDFFVDVGQDLVVLAEFDALVLQHVTDGGSHGGDGAGLAVDAQVDVLLEGGVT